MDGAGWWVPRWIGWEIDRSAFIHPSMNPRSTNPLIPQVSVSGGVSSVCSAVELIARQVGAHLYSYHDVLYLHIHTRPHTSNPPPQAGLFDGLGASESGGGRGRRGRRDSAGGEGDDYSEGGGAGGGGGPLGLRMVIDGNVAGQLIGKKGATINDIRQQSGARIQVRYTHTYTTPSNAAPAPPPNPPTLITTTNHFHQVLTDEDSLDEGGVDGERVVMVQGEETACRLAHQLIWWVGLGYTCVCRWGEGDGGRRRVVG